MAIAAFTFVIDAFTVARAVEAVADGQHRAGRRLAAGDLDAETPVRGARLDAMREVDPVRLLVDRSPQQADLRMDQAQRGEFVIMRGSTMSRRAVRS